MEGREELCTPGKDSATFNKGSQKQEVTDLTSNSVLAFRCVKSGPGRSRSGDYSLPPVTGQSAS